MQLMDRLAKGMGYGPLTLETAANLPASPWAGNNLASVDLAELFGLGSCIQPTRAKAMGLATVSKGRRAYAGNIGRMSFRTTKAGVAAPFQLSILDQPERDRSRAQTLTWTVDELLFYPHAYWVITERDFYGWPAWVKLCPNDQATTDNDGRLLTAWGNPIENYLGVIQFDAIDAGLLIDGAETIRRALVLNRAASLAEDNPVPALDIHNDGDDLNDDEIKELLDSWQAARRTRGVGYSSKGIKVTSLGLPVEQLLIEGRKAITLELVRHLGLPAWAVDAEVTGSTLNYTNRASRNWELIDLGLAPMMTAITSRLSMPDVTPRGWAVEFNTDELTRDDTTTRYTNYNLGIVGGYLSADEVRVLEGLA